MKLHFFTGLCMCVSLLCNLEINSAQAQDVSTLKDSLKVTGNVSLRTIGYYMSGIQNRRKPLSYVLSGDVTISKGEFSIPISVTFSEQDRSFSQPFNQYGIAPSYKWAKLYIGYQNLNWSKYSLNGHQILGAGFELKPKKWRVGFMYGRLKRSTGIDSTRLNEYTPSFKRTGFTGKIGYGTDDQFIDLVFLSAKDDPNSLNTVQDSLLNLTAAENFVLALKAQKRIFKWLTWNFDGALSAYNRDVNAENVGFNPEGTYAVLQPFFNSNVSASFYNAFETGLNASVKGQNIGLNYNRVSPDYQSMGSYFLENDVQSIAFTHSFSVFKNKLSVNYGAQHFNDNLLGRKEFSTSRLQPNVNLSFNPSPIWGIDASWNNMYTRQEDGTLQLSDTVRMHQQNPGYTILPRLTFGDTLKYHVIVLGYIHQQLLDFNRFTSDFSQYTSTVINANYSLSIIKANMGLNLGANRTQNVTQTLNEVGYGVSAGINKNWEKNKDNAAFTVGSQFTNLNTSLSVNLNYSRPFKFKQNLSGGFTWLMNQAQTNQTQSFNEYTLVLTYSKNF